MDAQSRGRRMVLNLLSLYPPLLVFLLSPSRSATVPCSHSSWKKSVRSERPSDCTRSPPARISNPPIHMVRFALPRLSLFLIVRYLLYFWRVAVSLSRLAGMQRSEGGVRSTTETCSNVLNFGPYWCIEPCSVRYVSRGTLGVPMVCPKRAKKPSKILEDVSLFHMQRDSFALASRIEEFENKNSELETENQKLLATVFC
ncbi:hypothetical protein BHE74_00015773 [Ensete ventricosum]|nr:hypothetical protein GW17_00024843 [Ensete ventricosum]RWW76158.1 hypothetical protein BHE74_00015773 [Ensete ventricosum]RZS19724.1 hypothetical protein BHM03_00052169 [Ensete ventricosum]